MNIPTPIYNIYRVLKQTAINDENIKAVTTGNIIKLDLDKHTIFELCHFQINNIRTEYATNNVIKMVIPNITMFLIDKLINTKDGLDNEIDIYNTLFVAGNNILNKLSDINQNTELEAIITNVNFEPFTERFENVLTGYAITFDMSIPYANIC